MSLCCLINSILNHFSVPVFLFVLILTLLFFEYLNAPKNLPPGPIGIPLLGYLPFVGSQAHTKLQEVAQKYGKICSFYFGRNLIIMISDYDILKEALVKQGENFAGRPASIPFKVFLEDIGIVTSEKSDYKALKSFIISTLKDAGGVKTEIENIIKENLEQFVAYLKTLKGKPSDVLEPLGLSVAMTYSQLLLNKRFEMDDPWFQELIRSFYTEQRLYVNGIRIYLPWAKNIPFISKLVGEDEARTIRKHIYQHLDIVVKECEATYVEGSKENFIHAWMNQNKKRKEKDPKDTLFDRSHLLYNIDVVFAGGYETTTTTLMWTLIFLVIHPEVQEKIRKETDEVIGKERAPSVYDLDRMHYTMATIQEIHRYATIAPLGLLHSNFEETTLCGYTIPKRSYILTNFMAVHFDPNNFPEPETFRPERFLDEDGRFKKPEKVINFSMGKRQCPGEPLAGVEIFLYIVTLLQNFVIVKPEDEVLCLDRSDSLSANPKRFQVRFIERKEQ